MNGKCGAVASAITIAAAYSVRIVAHAHPHFPFTAMQFRSFEIHAIRNPIAGALHVLAVNNERTYSCAIRTFVIFNNPAETIVMRSLSWRGISCSFSSLNQLLFAIKYVMAAAQNHRRNVHEN